ncbi:MAG TPA: TIGR03435 family protein [Terriglobales bacterium]|nr:TIGR03435 family protein [Terriglobales bacterium]
MRVVPFLILASALALSGFAQTAPAKFDAVSIKPAVPSSGQTVILGMQTDPGRLTAKDMTLKGLIQAAYGLKAYQVVGPDWLSTEHFDVSAETTAAVPRDRIARLLQPVLEQRFQLVTHRETRIMPIYALTGAGSKLKPAPEGESSGGFTISVNPQSLHLTGTSTMDDLTAMLGRQVDRPVINQTGIRGVYQIEIDYAPTGTMHLNGLTDRRSPDAGAETVAVDGPAEASLFTALREQLGLKLEARKGPIEILVIDSASKSPVGN